MQSNGRKRKIPIEPTPNEAMDLKSEYLRNDPGTLTEFQLAKDKKLKIFDKTYPSR